MGTHTIQVTVDDTVYQTAVNRATGEGKAVGQVVAEFLRQYAEGASAGVSTSYTIQRGDTLGRVAAKFYGDARKYPVIQRANNISNPSRIWVGQVLVIPPVEGSSATPPAAPITTPTLVAPPPPPTTPSTPVPPTPPAPPVVSTPAPAPIFSPAPAPAPGQPPQKPAIRWVGSPNFNNRRSPDDITGIVVHSTANGSLQGVIDWFNNASAQVSAHYTIGKDGQIVQHVQDIHRAWHAGRSVWKGRDGCNDYTIGIELVNLNDGADPYPAAQQQANLALCAYLAHKYSIGAGDIFGHLDCAIPPGRKSDPRGYDLDGLRNQVAAITGRR